MTPGTRLGPYEVIAPLGAGGMGEVYKAKDTKLDREVAMKVMPASMAQERERLARFEREAKVQLAQVTQEEIGGCLGPRRAVRPHKLDQTTADKIEAMKYRVLFEQDEDGIFVATCPSLPGCVAPGRSRSEATDNMREAIEAYLASLKKHGDPIPPSIIEDVIEVSV